MSAEWWMFLAGMLLTVGTGMFVASEFALVNLDRHELEDRRAKGETMLGLTIRGLKITSTHLSAAQLGITLTTLLAGFTLEPALSVWLSPVFLSWGLDDTSAGVVATVVAVAIATLPPSHGLDAGAGSAEVPGCDSADAAERRRRDLARTAVASAALTSTITRLTP